MSRALVVLRPEPGASATLARIAALGLHGIKLPLFAVVPVAWEAPDPAQFDALILTSANAIRHGGAALDRLRALPVHAVGETTAAAARARGFDVVATGDADAAALMQAAAVTGIRHALHLGARERTLEAGGAIARAITVYASAPVASPEVAPLYGSVALLHSARAAARLAALVPPAGRAEIALAALSPTVANAAGTGWRAIAVAARPEDSALLAAARTLFD